MRESKYEGTITKLFFIFITAIPLQVNSQTPEQHLRHCYIGKLEKYQPISSYSQDYSCDVENKKNPLKPPPSKGPFAIYLTFPGYVFIDTYALETFKTGEGGYTEPYINQLSAEVTSSIWCRAEDKLFGAGGHYKFKIWGTRQRIATKKEQRRVLQECTREIDGPWSNVIN